jgi:hypothetical protein
MSLSCEQATKNRKSKKWKGSQEGRRKKLFWKSREKADV